MIPHQIDFSTGSQARKYIQDEFRQEKWKNFRIWFLNTYSENDKFSISQEFYETCALHNKIMFFVPWFITTYLPLYVKVLEQRSYKDSSGQIVKSIYPPQAPFVLPNNTSITFEAFQKFIENDTAKISVREVNAIIAQNNYMSLYLKVLGEHLTSLDTKLDELTKLVRGLIQNSVAATTSSSKTPLAIAASIQRPLDVSEFVIKSQNDLEKLVNEKLANLDIKPVQLELDFADALDSSSNYKEIIDSELNKLRGFPQKQNSKYAMKPDMKTYYYPRPTPQDVLIEERDWNMTNTSYSGDQIYEWNLDGLTDRQISIMIHRMLMYSTICKATSSKNTDRVICKMIVAGFTGQLRGWWDNFLTEEQKYSIFSATNPNEGVDSLGFKLESGREDSIYTLICTIIEHFSGRFTNVYENIRTLLNNLKCKHLGEFRWYKDTFLSRVMDLPDSNEAHWKSKFVDGLPPLFAERIRKILRGSSPSIDYRNYTYGKLIGICTQEGLNLCNELKLSNQLKKEKMSHRSQLGDFCQQFGVSDMH